MKFTIRDLLWLTVVVALGVAWWANFRSLSQLRHKFDQEKEITGRWRQCVETLAVYMRTDGWRVEVDKAGWIEVVTKSGPAAPNPSAPAPNLPSD